MYHDIFLVRHLMILLILADQYIAPCHYH